MDETKRKSMCDQSLEEISKKLSIDQSKCSRTAIEHLPNDLFYEVFDYLNGCDVYEAFANLNDRFQQLVNISSLFFHMKGSLVFDEIYRNQFKRILLLNEDQVFSLDVTIREDEHFFTSFILNSTFRRLQSISVSGIEHDTLILLLVNLARLPHLFSLSIDRCQSYESLTDIYRLIFVLPALKYVDLTSATSKKRISLPIITSEQISPIECLIMEHVCTLNELTRLISYTPQLRYLRLHEVHRNALTMTNILPMRLSNLTYVYLFLHDITFDALEIFTRQVSCALKILRVFRSNDVDFLDASRWEQLISQHFPVLEQFYLSFYDDSDHWQHLLDFEQRNPFSSTFWMVRQWVFGATIDPDGIQYTVRPYKKRWSEWEEKQILYSSNQETSKSTELIVKYAAGHGEIDGYIERILTLTDIYHLTFTTGTLATVDLIPILDLLPNLITLQLHSLSWKKDAAFEMDDLLLIARRHSNQIQKIYLEKMDDIRNVHYLLTLCSRATYLKVGYIDRIGSDVFLRQMFAEINHDDQVTLRALCFRLPAADSGMIRVLQNMIDVNKLLVDYTIKRVLDDIYIQW